MPIKIPPGKIGRVIATDKITTSHTIQAAIQEIDNSDGTSPKLWPTEEEMDRGRQRGALPSEFAVWQCDIHNHGKSDISLLSFTLEVRYPPVISTFDPYQVIFGPIDRGQQESFYLVNNCPQDSAVTVPTVGFAHEPGDPVGRQFSFETGRKAHATETFQFWASKTNWTGMTCPE
jgi:hypothetical protein